MKQILATHIAALAHTRLLVVGDVLLDEYLLGRPTRLSREAPIPVLEFTNRRLIPGGAANPAMNAAALGGQVVQVGVIGGDEQGRELTTRLQQAGVDAAGLVVDAARPTSLKTRVVAQGKVPQQLARLDRLDRRPPDSATEAALLAQVETALPAAQALLVSDYRNGMLTPSLVQAMRQAARQAGSLTVVDSQGNLDKYRGFDIIRANDRDTAAYLGRPLETDAHFQQATGQLLAGLNTQGLVIGRGAQGVSLLGVDTPYTHFPPANVTEVFDVTGAGDTFSAVLTMCLVSGLDLAHSALLANYAAGWAVQKWGNATPTAVDLEQAIEQWP